MKAFAYIKSRLCKRPSGDGEKSTVWNGPSARPPSNYSRGGGGHCHLAKSPNVYYVHSLAVSATSTLTDSSAVQC